MAQCRDLACDSRNSVSRSSTGSVPVAIQRQFRIWICVRRNFRGSRMAQLVADRSLAGTPVAAVSLGGAMLGGIPEHEAHAIL